MRCGCGFNFVNIHRALRPNIASEGHEKFNCDRHIKKCDYV